MIVTLAVVGILFVIGLVLVPGVSLLLAPSLPPSIRTMLARIQFTIAALVNARNVMVERQNGTYEMAPARKRGGQAEVYLDGAWRELGDDIGWARLGKQPFGIIWERDDGAFEGTLVSEPGAATDGGEPQQLGQRGGEAVVGREGEGWTVNIAKLSSRYRDADGAALTEQAERVTLEEEGGDTSDMGTKVIVFGVLVSLLSGACMAWLMFG
jgi:hypothetical protein